MSLAETFFSGSKQFLLASDNLKRLEERVSRLADDVASVNLRLVRIETILAMQEPPRQQRRTRILPGEPR